jgi:hypothetical protein
MDEFDEELSGAPSQLVVEIDGIERTTAAHTTHGQREHWERIAAEHTQRFSHARKKKWAIRAYVQERFEVNGGFAMGLPVSLYVSMSDGIRDLSA